MKRILSLLALAPMIFTAAAQTVDYGKNLRPEPSERLFTSPAVERQIERIRQQLSVPKLIWMFENCFPNTLDTTVHYRLDEQGADDTFIYTGDIHAMWLRDSGAQVWPYLALVGEDEGLRRMIRGVIGRQLQCLLIDPYANAFNDGPTNTGWQEDWTEMKPELHERKWELDSPCYVIRLAYGYWKKTADATVFDSKWVEAMRLVLKTLRNQQRREGPGDYRFQRVTEDALDTQLKNGYGHPARPVGLIASSFRPSDDATTFPFLIPSNFFAVSSLRKAAEILRTVNREEELAAACEALASEVAEALAKYATCEHPLFGTVYAYEVDGYGNRLLMDDANVPSLLAMAYLGDVAPTDPVYRNTRRLVWSESNPYYFRGSSAAGIGSPHTGADLIWPMSLIMRAMTSDDDAEIRDCIQMLVNTDGGTGFIHESFHKDNPAQFSRSWFAWANTLFGELILHLIDTGKTDLLNSIEIR